MDKPEQSRDIRRFLEEWEYKPDEVLVRVIVGDDGREKIQLRIDMGLMQMETSGRPDGQSPRDCESWLDYYEGQQRAHDVSHPDSTPFLLDDDACARLWREGIQYYHRYLSFWHLERFESCVRDTERNLRLFIFVRDHAKNDRQKLQFEQYRPYVTMMHRRALATPLVQGKKFAEALDVIESGIDAIRDFLEEYGQSEREEECLELASLEQWREEILLEEKQAGETRPKSVLDILRHKLKEAVAAEHFEEAADLRDQIRQLSDRS